MQFEIHEYPTGQVSERLTLEGDNEIKALAIASGHAARLNLPQAVRSRMPIFGYWTIGVMEKIHDRLPRVRQLKQLEEAAFCAVLMSEFNQEYEARLECHKNTQLALGLLENLGADTVYAHGKTGETARRITQQVQDRRITYEMFRDLEFSEEVAG